MKITLAFLLVALAHSCLSDPVQIKPTSTVEFNHFWTFDEIEEYLEELELNFHDVAHVENYGTSAEGRNLNALHIATAHGTVGKPVIVIEGGLRPREWIGVMSAVYFIHEIVEHYYEFTDILDHVEFLVIPVVNPDGYVYTHTTNRQWNKNRRSVGSGCFGVDINANFYYQFLRTNDPCAENYSGEAYFSERESSLLSSFLSSGKYLGRVAMYISMQAYGEQILLPFNYVNSGAANTEELTAVANRAIAAIRSRNSARNYQVGIGAGLRSVQRGTSTDYAKGSANVEYVFTYMLPRGSGATGYEVTTTELPGIISETFLGLREMSLYLAER